MRYLIIFIVFASILATSASGLARPKKGFHTGPYLALEAGIMQVDFDYDQVIQATVGRDFEPSAGFIFGWNLWDFFSAELQGRYSTNFNAGRREHIAGANMYGKWTLIADCLTDFETFRILPFAKGGLALRVAALPSTPAAGSGIKTSFGLGPSLGGGIAFMWHKYFYFGADFAEDLLIFNSISQSVGGVPDTLVYSGGFHPSFGVMGFVGVHY